MTVPGDADQLEVLRRFAPGTDLRDAVELVLRQRTGALVLFGGDDEVDPVCSGGFTLEATPFTAQRLAELAKMDGGIVVSKDAAEILRANVHFIPDPKLPTIETGTRFRTAERLAAQTGLAVLAVSEEGRSVAAVYIGADRFELRPPAVLLGEANQNLLALERLRRRLVNGERELTQLEVDDDVTVGDVVKVLERAELVRRMGAQVNRIVVELGGQAHLIAIQASDLLDGVEELAQTVFADYATSRRKNSDVFNLLAQVAMKDLHHAPLVANALKMDEVGVAVRPRGIRALKSVPRLPENVRDALIAHFKTLPKLLAASEADLAEVEGVGRTRAVQLRSYLDRLSHDGHPFHPSE